LLTLGLNSLGGLLEVYLRIQKWSVTFVAVSLGRFTFNAAVNVTLLAFFGMGIAGVLIGNLVTAVLATGVVFILFAHHRGCIRIGLTTARRLWAYGIPLIAAGLMGPAMSQSDRYFLRSSVGLTDVGIYSVAFALGQGVSTLISMPFQMSWGPVRFEIAGRSDSRKTYVEVFHYFMTG